MSIRYFHRCLIYFALLWTLPVVAWGETSVGLELSQEERAWLQQHPRLRYCFSPVWRPYDYFEDNAHQGMFRDYLELFAQKLGVDLEPVPTSVPEAPGDGWKKALRFAEDRRCDFISGAVRTPEREGYLDFSTPYFHITQVLIALTDKPFVSGIEALQHQTIGVPPGSAISTMLRRDFPQLNQVPLGTQNAAAALDSGQVYAYVTPLEHAIGWMAERVHNYKIIGKLDHSYPVSVATRNDWPQLLPLMNRAVAALTQEEHDAIQRRWNRHTYTLTERVDYTYLWLLAGAALLVIGVILYWNRRLVGEIAQRRQAEQALRESEARFRNVIEASPIPYALNDGGQRITFLNRAFVQTFGYTLQDISVLAEWWPRAYPDPAYRQWVADAWDERLRRAARTQTPFEPLEIRICCKDGSFRTVAASATPLRETYADLLLVVLYDITERKQAEDRIVANEQRLRRLGDNLPDGTVHQLVHRADGRVYFTHISAGVERVLGVTPAEVLADPMNLYGLVHPDDRAALQAAEAASKQNLSLFDQVARHYARSGELRWLHIRSTPYRKDDGSTWWDGFAMDVSAQKQVENDLIRARHAAEAANQAKSAFLANMSHELRTPLNAVLGFAQILLQDAALSPTQRNQLQSIQRGGEYLLTLINDILDLAKIEAGRFELFPHAWDTQSFFQELGYMFRVRAEQQGLQFSEESAGLPHALYCDDKRLRQVLMNLLGNAVKFTERGGVVLRSGYTEGRLRLEVQDSGVGMTTTDLGRIFEPFQQTGADRYKVQGTGLGLAISHRLVQAMGGSLSVDSTPGLGSVFRVEIPAQVVAEGESLRPASVPATVIGYRRDPDAPHLRLLLVDDQEHNRAVLRGLLEPLGFAVAEADSGEHCLRLAPEWRPDLILMDLRMPGLDGLETTRRLRATPECAAIPVVVVSASAFNEDRAASEAAGCSAHLGKPVRREELLETLRQLLGLAWVYAEAAAPPPEPQTERLPPSHAAEFVKLVRCGDITGLQNFVEQLQQTEVCPEFSRRLKILAQDFDIGAIVKLAEFYQRTGEAQSPED